MAEVCALLNAILVLIAIVPLRDIELLLCMDVYEYTTAICTI